MTHSAARRDAEAERFGWEAKLSSGSDEVGKLPAFQFYPADWLADAVAGCSIAAQGLWLRMMILMHGCEPYGYLVQQGEPIPAERIARMCGVALGEYSSLLGELDSAGVPSRTPNGTIYSRRMVRDAKQRAKWRKWQSSHRHGGSHAEVNQGCHGDVMPMSSHSSSSSSSSTSKTKEKAVGVAPTNGARPAFSHPLLEINSSQDEKLRDVYPWVDRAHEYKKMGLWLEGNRPGRRVKNTLAFCQNWFNKIPCGRIGVERGEKIKRTEEAAKRYLAGRGEMARDPGPALRDRTERD